MKLRLDTVHGHEIITHVSQGRISRMALATAAVGELPSLVPSSSQLINALSVLGLPQKGAEYPHPDYEDYYLKTHIARAFDALNYGIEMIYEWKGLRTITDTSTLSTVPTQIHPKDNKPLYIRWLPPGVTDPLKAVTKLLTLNDHIPMRHLIISATLDYMASPDVINAFPSVNQFDWMGLPKGYWMYSGIDGFTDDNITYTYTATFSTKQIEDWSQYGFMYDDTGQPIAVPEADVVALRTAAYSYGRDTSKNGILKVGMKREKDFFNIFGV